MQVTDVHFPSLDASDTAAMGQIVRYFIDVSKTVTVSMDRIVAGTPKNNTPASTVTVKNDPPTIYVSNTPAILLQMQGEPASDRCKKGRNAICFQCELAAFPGSGFEQILSV